MVLQHSLSQRDERTLQRVKRLASVPLLSAVEQFLHPDQPGLRAIALEYSDVDPLEACQHPFIACRPHQTRIEQRLDPNNRHARVGVAQGGHQRMPVQGGYMRFVQCQNTYRRRQKCVLMPRHYAPCFAKFDDGNDEFLVHDHDTVSLSSVQGNFWESHMCSNYEPVAQDNLDQFGYGLFDFEYGSECYPQQIAPFLANCSAHWLPGVFGLLPHWAKPDLARRTYNARSETVASLPSFRAAWRRRQLAVVPVQSFFEPNYETGRPVRWRIMRQDGEPFGLAGIWEQRHLEGGELQWSFTMLTVNADDHPLMSRFHAPGKEKRSVVVLDNDGWNTWLQGRDEDDLRHGLRLFDPDVMTAEPAPRPVRTGRQNLLL